MKKKKAPIFILALLLLIGGAAAYFSGSLDGAINKGMELFSETSFGEKIARLIDANPWEKSETEDEPPAYDDIEPQTEITGDESISEDRAPVKQYATEEYNTVSGDLGEDMSDYQMQMATDGMMRYSYSFLSDKDRALYRDIYSILQNHAQEVVIASLSADDIDRVFQLVMNDHPEIFYVDGYSMNKYTVNGKTTSIDFSGKYTKTKAQQETAQVLVDEYVKECFRGLPDTGRDYDKVAYLYEYIIDRTDYSLSAVDNQNILSVFIEGRSVCQGYAKSMQYMLNKLGIPCLIVQGRVHDGESHAWNLAYVDGTWTVIDATWGDAAYHDVTTGEHWNEISYDYLCVSDEDIADTHIPMTAIEMPVASRVNN